MQILLTAAQKTSWDSDPSWKNGFLLGIQAALQDNAGVAVVTIAAEADPNTAIFKAVKKWAILP